MLAHELIHIRRKDYLIKPAAFLVTVIHWFNPLVWLAFWLMEKDMELSCDEAEHEEVMDSLTHLLQNNEEAYEDLEIIYTAQGAF